MRVAYPAGDASSGRAPQSDLIVVKQADPIDATVAR